MFTVAILGFLYIHFRPLGPENLLLRGARLKNTKEIYGESNVCKKPSRRLDGSLLWNLANVHQSRAEGPILCLTDANCAQH